MAQRLGGVRPEKGPGDLLERGHPARSRPRPRAGQPPRAGGGPHPARGAAQRAGPHGLLQAVRRVRRGPGADEPRVQGHGGQTQHPGRGQVLRAAADPHGPHPCHRRREAPGRRCDPRWGGPRPPAQGGWQAVHRPDQAVHQGGAGAAGDHARSHGHLQGAGGERDHGRRRLDDRTGGLEVLQGPYDLGGAGRPGARCGLPLRRRGSHCRPRHGAGDQGR